MRRSVLLATLLFVLLGALCAGCGVLPASPSGAGAAPVAAALVPQTICPGGLGSPC
jgi:hypothetical protein